MSQSFVDAQIRAQVSAIVAVDLHTESGYRLALRLKDQLVASFSEPGLSRVLSSYPDGRIVRELRPLD